MMQNKKANILYPALIPLVLALGVVAAIFSIKWEYICTRLVMPDIVEWKRPSQKTSPLYGDRVVRQYFTSNFDGLFRVGFALEYRDPGEAKMEVVIREEDRDKELFKGVVPLNRFPENKMYRFTFSPQWDSAGKTYYLIISAHEAQPGTELRLFFDPGPFFHVKTKGKLFFCDKEVTGELSMVSECRVKVDKSEFLSFWRNFIADRGFAVFYTGILAIALLGLIFTGSKEFFYNLPEVGGPPAER